MAEALNSANAIYTYHTHVSSCYSICTGTALYTREGATGTVVMTCNRCGQIFYRKISESDPFTCNTKSLVCGKSENTIESVEITFD